MKGTRLWGDASGLPLFLALGLAVACNADANAVAPSVDDDSASNSRGASDGSGGSGGDSNGGKGSGSGGDSGSGGSGGDQASSSQGTSGGSGGNGGTGGATTGGATDNGSNGGGSNTTTNDTTNGSGGDSTASGGGGGSGSGGTGEPACLEPATATGPVTLIPDDGRIDCSTNTVGVQGDFFTYSDDGGSTITPSSFEGAGDSVCVSGMTAAVIDEDFETTWGAGVALNLNDESAWNASAVGVGGIQFSLSDLPSNTLRVFIQTSAGDHCIEISTAGTHIVRFEETSIECWDTGGAIPNLGDLYQIKWQVGAEPDVSSAFEFCLSNFAAVP